MVLEVREEVEIAASARDVAAELAAFDDWAAWNTVAPEPGPPPRRGGSFRLGIVLPSGRRLVVGCTWRQVDLPRRLEWSGGLPVPGLFDAVHGFEIEELGPDRCRVLHHETFRGLLVPLLRVVMGRDVGARHRAVNEALARRVERSD